MFAATGQRRTKKSQSSSTHPHWAVKSLEQRLMLAADVGAAISVSPASDGISAVQTSSVNLVFVDSSINDLDQITAGIEADHELILLDADRDGLTQITEALRGRQGVSSVHIIAHGDVGQIQLGNQIVDHARLIEYQQQLQSWRGAFSHDADILLYSCDTAAGEIGQQFIRRFAGLTGADVAASDDTTGSELKNGDWVLEQTIGVIETGLAIHPTVRDEYAGVLPITIRAAGATNQETMELQIDGQTVRTFNNVGGDADAGSFVDFTYNANGISLDRIRVAFTNDLYDEAAGIDRNLRVDSITVDGTTYNTEDATVFSTGTWLPSDGIVDGFGRGDVLNSDGYFQYASSDSATTIDIRARGETGQESMSLQIDGVTVQTWNNVGTSEAFYTYTADGTITGDRVRVTFNNDFFDEASNTDRNLTVNFIRLDGQAIQTESSNVFSNGTFLPQDGIVPGFGRGETLHTDGYFQYGNENISDDTRVVVFARGFEGDENIELQIDGETVRQWNTIGVTQRAFAYDHSSSVNPSQVRVVFTNDLLDEATSTDRNVLVDRIEIGADVYQSEASTVFSNATWTSADGIVPGFGRGQILHTNGYFDYGGSGSGSESGSFSIANSVISVNESEGIALVTINRTGGSNTLATIEYRTVSGSATDGADFSGVDDTLTFQPGVTSQDVAIPLISDSNPEGTETFSFTIDNPSGAGISVPRTATITINDVDLPNYADFADVSNIQLNGSAQQFGGLLQVTDAGGFLTGSAYFETAIPVNANTSFQSNFAFQLTGGGGAGGADGFTFILQNSSDGTEALGPLGGYFSYLGVTNSLAIEFDTYANPWDVNANHVSVLVNGNVENPIATKSYPVDLNDGGTKYAWIDYNGTNNVLAVYLSETNVKPGTPLIVTNVDLSSLVGNQMYAGFGAGTGSVTNNHEIVSWTMNTEVPPIPNEPAPGGTLVSKTVASGFAAPTSIDFTADGSVLYVAEQRGIVTAYQNGARVGQVLDFTDRVNGTRDRGLLDIAVHPDLANNPYMYLLYTYDPPEVFGHGGLAGPDGNGNRAGRLTRVTLDAATGYTTIVAGSEEVLIGKNSTWENFNAFTNSTSKIFH